MKLLWINGSPNQKQGNSEIFIRQLQKGMKQESTVRYAYGSSLETLAKEILEYDTCIIVMPLYVFAMPSMVMKLFETLGDDYQGRRLGFIVQQGFDESCHSDFLLEYLPTLANRKQFTYMGTIVKGGAAGTRWLSDRMNQALFQQLQEFASVFERCATFPATWIQAFQEPHRLSKKQLRLYRILTFFGITKLMWLFMLGKNHALRRRFDQPYLQ